MALGGQEGAHAAQQRARAPADADVAVKEERRAPGALPGQRAEDRALDDQRAARAGQPGGVGGQFHTDGEHAAAVQCGDVAAGATADVQRGALDTGEGLVLGLGGRAEPASHGQSDGAALAGDRAQAQPRVAQGTGEEHRGRAGDDLERLGALEIAAGCAPGGAQA